jgi:HPt (histidine-containing phosphotransfer) domain-containing protein
MIDVIGLFLRDTPGQLEAIRAGLGRADEEGVERAAHTLKSSAATVGATSLAQLAASTEDAARHGRVAEVSLLVPRLAAALTGAARRLATIRHDLLGAAVASKG